MPFLSALTVIAEARVYVPPCIVAATAPVFLISSSAWGVLSSVLPKKCFVIVDDKMYSAYQRFLLFFFEVVSGVRLRLYGDADLIFRNKENVLYISNHQSTVDWAVVDMLAIRQGSLGSVRYMLKDGLQFLPMYGWYFYQHGCVYVRRKNFKTDIVERELNYLAQPQVPLWLCIFPEGTRFYSHRRKALQQSAEFANAAGLTPLSHLYTPRSRGFQLAVERLRHKLDAVYDVTIIYSGTKDNEGNRIDAPDMTHFVASGSTKRTLHVHVKRYDIAEVPEENEIQPWLHNLFLQKEQYFNRYYNESLEDEADVFPGPCGSHELPLRSTLPFFFMFTVPALAWLATPSGRDLYSKVFLFGTLAGYAWLKIRRAA